MHIKQATYLLYQIHRAKEFQRFLRILGYYTKSNVRNLPIGRKKTFQMSKHVVHELFL